MSLWCDLNGFVRIPKNTHFSLKTFTEEYFRGEDYSFKINKVSSSQNTRLYNLVLCVEGSGDGIYKFIESFNIELKSKGCDTELSVRLHL